MLFGAQAWRIALQMGAREGQWGETIWANDVRLVVKPVLCENVFRPLIEFSKRRWRGFSVRTHRCH